MKTGTKIYMTIQTLLTGKFVVVNLLENILSTYLKKSQKAKSSKREVANSKVKSLNVVK